MVGIVLVSHSQKLAESVAEFTATVAAAAHVATAGGLEDGSFGTSFEKIYKAVEAVDSKDGVIILMDMGSAVMTTEMVVEAYGSNQVVMADCPFVEGAIMAAIGASGGLGLDQILGELKKVGTTPKL